MITDKQSLKEYMKKDKYALGLQERKRPRLFGDEIWKYEIFLRKHEYYLNTGQNKLLLRYYKCRHHSLGVKLGFSIPCNVFGAGLRINNCGYIAVSTGTKIGEFCNIHPGVNIGEEYNKKSPTIGDNVFIAPGAKIFGEIKIGNNVMIGSNAVVDKSFDEDNVVIEGVPATIVSGEKNFYIQ